LIRQLQENHGSGQRAVVLFATSTNLGLSTFDPVTKTFINFDVNDGLQSNEFNDGASFAGANDELFFGGVNGFNRFFPALLQQAINSLEHLTLSYKENFFSFDFAALYLIHPIHQKYAYQLQGWDKDWIETDAKNRRATYTNIPSGDYLFNVKSADKTGSWGNDIKTLSITILPPLWKTWWAYSICVFFGAVVILLFVYVRLEHNRAEREHHVNVQLKQVDKLKDEFLANTSHELRTPLNGIIGLAESLMDGVADQLPDKANHNLAMVVSSGKRLANLVNDILDFSKLNNRNMELHTRPIDLHTLVDVIR
jgi:signal transduction histidine kinase